MSDCSAGGVTIHCEGGCGAISAGSTVWVWCEPVVIDMGEVRTTEAEAPAPRLEPTVAEVHPEGEARREDRLNGSESVQLDAHGLSRDGLIGGLRVVLDTELEPSGEAKEGDLSFSGTVDETLDYLGLRRSWGASSY